MDTISAKPTRFAIKPLHLAALSIILVAVIFAGFSFQGAMRSYVTDVAIAEQAGRSVQLAGFLGSKGEYDAQGRWTFMLQDDKGKMVKVVYGKPRPANFEQAISIVAIGQYDPANSAFVADDLLVKCPSKYQEIQKQQA